MGQFRDLFDAAARVAAFPRRPWHAGRPTLSHPAGQGACPREGGGDLRVGEGRERDLDAVRRRSLSPAPLRGARSPAKGERIAAPGITGAAHSPTDATAPVPLPWRRFLAAFAGAAGAAALAVSALVVALDPYGFRAGPGRAP